MNMEGDVTTITMDDYSELKNKELALDKALQLIEALEKTLDSAYAETGRLQRHIGMVSTNLVADPYIHDPSIIIHCNKRTDGCYVDIEAMPMCPECMPFTKP